MTPDELRKLAVTLRSASKNHLAMKLFAAADAWDETEGRLFDSHGMVMDLRERLEAAEKAPVPDENGDYDIHAMMNFCDRMAALAGEVQP